MTIALGQTPQSLRVIVEAGGTFAAAIRRADGVPWADDAELILDFGSGVQWSAVNTADVALWQLDGAAVDALLATTPSRVSLWYAEPGARLLWARGAVERWS